MYQLGYESLEVSCIIREDGSAIVRRRVKLRAFGGVDEIDNYLLSPEKLPAGEKIKNLRVKSLTPNFSVASRIQEEPKRTSAILSFTPPLSDGQSLEYEMVEELPPKFYAIGCLEEELTKRENPFDYYGWNINRPTYKLTLMVYFPEHAKPNFYRTQVRYASSSGFPSNRLQHKEQAHLKSPQMIGPDGDRYVLKLEIDFPMIGLIYILRWKPMVGESTSTQEPSKILTNEELELNYLTELRQILTTRFNEGELQTFCFDLGVDYKILSGQTSTDKARELLAYFKRRKQLDKLVEIGKRVRSDISWPVIPL